MSQHNNRGFASDNNAGIHPALLEAIARANEGHVIAYGDDPYTRRAESTLKKFFGNDSEPFLVLTGTGANVLSLAALTRPYNAVICAESSHINTDECGAPEKFTQCKLIAVPTRNGKLTPEHIQPYLQGFGFEHHVQPRVISISQSTEMGTVYTVEEIKAISRLARQYDMYLHMDGARLANAAVSLEADFRAITGDAGVDVLSFGGTKNGMLCGEAVIFFRKELAENFRYIRKQGMQLVSKMRFIAAQFEVYLERGLWKANASRANAMAQLLFEKIKDLPGVTITQPVQANGVFAVLSQRVIARLLEKYFFYVWDERRHEVRWMTSFDTSEEDIETFAGTLGSILEES